MPNFNAWGNAYYSEKSNTSKLERWAELLRQKYPVLKEEVQRTVKQWNLQVRDHLRNETALRLSIGTDTSQVAVRVEDGFPYPLADVLGGHDRLAPLLLHKRTLEQTEHGIEIARRHFEQLSALVEPNFDDVELSKVGQWFHRVIRELNKTDITKQLANIDQDILGAYYFRESRVEIYWMAIGVVSLLYGIPVPALTTVVLAHELAHAYTHLGKDIDAKSWNTQKFAQADLAIVEGLAQFYTEVVCKKLFNRFPDALAAYESLLEHQSAPYRVQLEWANGHDHQGEIIRFSMVHARTSEVTEYGAFADFISQQERSIGRV
ncbi:hypothetical protein NX722_25400 [Endozoicomonas gorgoniicola]|uniref:Uncharacterized protein n=1 Tax=Endozoicomonas gorgoniicola TaxID=1234144 RepID=A0ABT3N2Q1_9GAMM|nr:hypothetical protein [Endozoicomonas gorgoniicola]MCW7555904.1 hypothetical protein [Endozoicomonas gorgoniicola]